MTHKPATTVHARLEQLQTAATREHTAQREAAAAVGQAEGKLQSLTERIVAAYANGDDQGAAKYRQELAAAEEELRELRHRMEARAQRASTATATATAFRVEHAEELLAELRPDAAAITAQLREALDRVVALDAEWSNHAQRTNALVALAPGSQPLHDGAPADHPYAATIRQLRHLVGTGSVVPVPEPRWEGRAMQADRDHAARLVRAQRAGNQTQVERLKQVR